MGVNLDISGVLLSEGLLCLLVGTCLGEALSPSRSGLPLLLWSGFVCWSWVLLASTLLKCAASFPPVLVSLMLLFAAWSAILLAAGWM